MYTYSVVILVLLVMDILIGPGTNKWDAVTRLAIISPFLFHFLV